MHWHGALNSDNRKTKSKYLTFSIFYTRVLLSVRTETYLESIESFFLSCVFRNSNFIFITYEDQYEKKNIIFVTKKKNNIKRLIEFNRKTKHSWHSIWFVIKEEKIERPKMEEKQSLKSLDIWAFIVSSDFINDRHNW